MKMPQMGESITEATILKWLKGVGDSVEQDETILEISTDKVDSEIPAPATGVIAEILAQEGETVPVSKLIAIIDSEAKAGSAPAKSSPATAATPAAPAQNDLEPIKSSPAPAQTPTQATENTESESSDKFYSPLVKSLAQQHGVSLSELDKIKGTGTQGRITKEDFLSYASAKSSASPAPQAQTSSAPVAKSTKAEITPERPVFGPDGTKVEPFDKMRKIIAEHMVRSKHTSPHVYTVAECDVSALSKWRKINQDTFLDREGFKLSFTPFFLEATVKALMHFPRINATVDGENLVLKRDINLGCAVALGNSGLIVPVIKNAEQLNLVGIARSLNDLALRARSKKLDPKDIQNGTFTVTNLGVFGSILGCPIINQPQLAILGLGIIKKRPVVVDDMIAIREMCYLTLSYDHRVIDGSLGGQFLQFIVQYLESWNMDRKLY